MTDYEICSLIFQTVIINISIISLTTTLIIKIVGAKNIKK